MSEPKGPSVGSENGALMWAVWRRVKELAHREDARMEFPFAIYSFPWNIKTVQSRWGREKIQFW